MKKFLPLLVAGILVLSGLGAVAINVEKETDTETVNTENLGDPKDYTHTVFVEWGSACFCGPCASWSSYIWNEYNSGTYDFEYVTMIVYGHGGWNDILNTKARAWNNLYGFTSYPTNIMDGDYRRQTNQPSAFPGNLDACGNRDVKDLDATLTVTHKGDAKLEIDIEIKNNEASTYSGYIRVPISEIDSRYTNAYGQKYHFGFLDYAFPMNKAIEIPAGGTYTDSVTWDGSEHKDNHGDYFDDIEPDNIMVHLGVFNNADGYIDETVATACEENKAPEKPTISGPTTGEPGIEYEYTFVTTDSNNDDVKYFIDWGDDNIDGWLGPYPSGQEIKVSHTYDENEIYEITAQAKDINELEGPWSDPYPVIIGNIAPEIPEISGKTSGEAGKEYEYTFVSSDPNGDDISYYIKWGDDTITDWTTFQGSGTPYLESHSWSSQDTYKIEAKAKDPDGAESDWGTLIVKMPRNRVMNRPFLSFLEKHPQLFPLLQLVLQRLGL